nr:hypothetical protein [Tanacetum cinerariifolium]
PGVLAGPNPEHPEAEVGDSSSQQQTVHIDEGFTATLYPNIQENLKLPVHEPQPLMTESRTIKRMGELELLFKGVVERNTAVEERLDKHWGKIRELED